jgi:hypothetical protein
LQVRQELGLVDHVWTDKKKSIAQNLDDLGDEFRPPMCASWLSYIHSVYREEGAPAVCLVDEEDTFVVNDGVYAAAECYKHSSAIMDDAIVL